MLPTVNLLPDGRLDSVPISFAVTLTSTVPGFVPEKISPLAEAILISLSVVNVKLLLDLRLVPLLRDTLLSELLYMVTLPFALLPVSFLPVASVETSPSMLVETLFAAMIFLEKSFPAFDENVTFAFWVTTFGLTDKTIVAFTL